MKIIWSEKMKSLEFVGCEGGGFSSCNFCVPSPILTFLIRKVQRVKKSSKIVASLSWVFTENVGEKLVKRLVN